VNTSTVSTLHFKPKVRTYIALGIALISISWASILVILSRAPATVCALWRLTFSSLITWALLLARKGHYELSSLNKSHLTLIVISGTALASHFSLWMESLFHLPVALSTTVVVTYPIISLVIDSFVFHERPRSVQVLGVILAFTGITLLTGLPKVLGIPVSVIGALYAFVASIAAAVYFSIGRKLRRELDTLTYTCLTYSTSSIVLFIYSTVSRIEVFNYSLETWIYLLALALIPMLGGHTILNYVLRYMSTVAVTAIALGEPVVATVLAKFILGQEVKTATYMFMGRNIRL